MAAVDPGESEKILIFPTAELELANTDKYEDPANHAQQQDESATKKTTDAPELSQKSCVVSEGAAFTSQCEVGDQPTAEANSATLNSPGKHEVVAEKGACDNAVQGGELRTLDWSESEDNTEEQLETQGPKRDPSLGTEIVEEGNCTIKTTTELSEPEINKQETSSIKEKDNENEKEKAVDQEADPDEDLEPSSKPRKSGMICKECGKSFTRRETFNLHRHFHLHEDELKPLTCKECGLTFQQRSGFIKHRNEHKEKERECLSFKRGVSKKEEGTFECAECAAVFITVDKLRSHKCSYADDIFFHCPICRQEFKFRSSVTRHMLSHSQEKFQCPECNQTFLDPTSLSVHQRSHAALKPYECPECGMVFKHYSVMADHRRKHTEGSRPHLCNICGKSFKYSSLLHQHQYLHTGQKPFRCPECGKKFAFAQNLKAHCRQHSLKKNQLLSPTEKLKNPEKENAFQSKDSTRTFKCPLCPQTYSAPASLRNHLHTHEAEYDMLDKTPRSPKEPMKWDKGHNCPHCANVYRDELSLNVHLSSVHKPDAPKTVTMVSPKSKPPEGSDDIQGNRGTEKLKSFKCPECGKPFRHRSVLELHMRIHSKDKPYQCKVCGKSFRFSSYLQQHLIIHTGKKPYQCPECGKDFAFLQNMRTHQKLHQEKPFRCSSCRKGYSDEAQLKHHMLSHNGDKPHKCNLCDKSFGLAYLLRDHMNTHTGDRPHRCDECNKSFSWFSSLLVHQKIHARKRQGFNQHNSFHVGTRFRGRGSRGQRGGRSVWGTSRPFAGSEMAGSLSSVSSDSLTRDADMQRNAEQPPPTHAVGMDLQSSQKTETLELQPPPVRWKVDGGEIMPVPSIQQTYAASQPTSFNNATSAATIETSPTKEKSPSYVGPSPTVMPEKSSPTSASETEQHRQLTSVARTSPSTSAIVTTSSLHSELTPSATFIDGAALWSVRQPATTSSSQNSPKKLGKEVQTTTRQSGSLPATSKKEESRTRDSGNPHVPSVSQSEKPWTSGLPNASSLTPMAPCGIGTLWDIQASPGIHKTLNSPDQLVTNPDFQLQQKQVSPSWAGIQSQTTTHKVPISIQYDRHRFGQGIGAPVWGFQSGAMLTGQLKSGNIQELQPQQPIVTGTKIIINQPSHFFSPPLAPLPPIALPASHPLHSVAVSALSRPPHPNIFFTPQAVTQTLSLAQLPPQTEPHKLGPRLAFPDRLHQCMICGCSLPREVDLQLHYMQHAQGEI